MTRRFAEVVVDIHNRKVDRSFHYAVPDTMQLEIGSRVVVPFNRRTVEGIVVGLDLAAPAVRARPIISCLDKEALLSPELIETARWMADYYVCPFVQALQCILPAPFGVREEIIVKVLVPPDAPDVQALGFLDPEAGKVFQAVHKGRKPVKLKNLTTRLGKEILPHVESLVARGLLAMETQHRVRAVSGGASRLPETVKPRTGVELTPAQHRAVTEIEAVLGEKGRTVLLHGVTGSGKTEVYVRLVSRLLQSGQRALVLVPEIALTPQIYKIFSEAFPGRVAVLHSGMAAGERAREYQKVAGGEAGVVVGARSAVFAPVKNLGMIIIDEEHEQAYKQEESPKYHVREVAQKRAELCGCTVVLGSATPSLESYALALTGKYKLVSLEERIDCRPLPPVEIVDLREELVAGNRSVFSRLLIEKLQDRFDRGEQAILFLNRRGYSTFVVCRECGYTAKCPRCDISLTYHLGSGELRCHYCNHSVSAPQSCPACNSRHIRYFGLGTQRVEQEIHTLFPAVKALRLDTDSTGRIGAHSEILAEFGRGEAQVLIGTQMVAKGLDFPRVTLVGVVSADITLNMPDFRARERTFQLLAQVAGRAGRGALPGEVVIQTFSPGDPCINSAREHDYQGFFRQEISFRRALGYPPFNHLFRVVLSGEVEANVIRSAQDLGGALRQELEGRNRGLNHPLEILGPAPSPLSKLKNRYRWQVILKGKQVADLKAGMGNAIKQLYQYSSIGGISLSLDLDPMGMI